MSKTMRWASPERDGPPTITMVGAAEQLGYSRQWIHSLVAKRGLPAWLPTIQNGVIVGWHRQQAGEKDPFKRRLFYPQDLKRWADLHPVKGERKKYRTNPRPADYSAEEQRQILEEVKPIVTAVGKKRIVKMPDLLKLFKERYGEAPRNARQYRIMRAVLRDEGITVKRVYPPRQA